MTKGDFTEPYLKFAFNGTASNDCFLSAAMFYGTPHIKQILQYSFEGHAETFLSVSRPTLARKITPHFSGLPLFLINPAHNQLISCRILFLSETLAIKQCVVRGFRRKQGSESLGMHQQNEGPSKSGQVTVRFSKAPHDICWFGVLNESLPHFFVDRMPLFGRYFMVR